MAGILTGRGLSCGEVGAFSEMIVSADLISLGWQVYRAVSPASRFDMVAARPDGSAILRVEVTTGNVSSSGNIHRPQKDNERFDVLAVVLPNRDVFYEVGGELIGVESHPKDAKLYVLYQAERVGPNNWGRSTCDVCSVPFTKRRRESKYCSKRCQVVNQRLRGKAAA